MIKKVVLRRNDAFDIIISIYLIVLFFAAAIIRGMVALYEFLSPSAADFDTNVILNILYIVTFICTVCIVLKRKAAEAVILTSIWILIVCMQLVMFSMNKELIFENLPMIIMGPYAYLLVRSIKSPKIYLMCLYYMVLILSIGGILAYILFLRNIPYSMNYSYLMAFATIFFIVISFEKNTIERKYKILGYILPIVMCGIILLNGSRGAFLAICICVIIIIARKLHGRFVILILILFPICYYITFNILPLILKYLMNKGISSRTFSLLFSGDISKLLYMSRRDILYEKIYLAVIQHPVFGVGLLGDRLQFDIYPHNFYLEIILQYGIIIGLIIGIMITYTCIKGVKSSYSHDWTALCIVFVSFEFTKIMVSSSYLVDIVFWIMLGIAVSANNIFKFKVKQR